MVSRKKHYFSTIEPTGFPEAAAAPFLPLSPLSRPLSCLGRGFALARRRQQQEQGALALVFRSRAAVLQSAHDRSAGAVADLPLPPRPAAPCQNYLEHCVRTASTLCQNIPDNVTMALRSIKTHSGDLRVSRKKLTRYSRQRDLAVRLIKKT
jgi:hypothetical protein